MFLGNRLNLFLLLFVGMITFFLAGCRWQDDFRSRQSQYVEMEPAPTFNEDSEYYVGDEIAKEGMDELEIDRPDVPTIDNLSKIPPVKEYPELE